MGKYFGTDGFRGEANGDLTVDHAMKIGRFLGWYYGKERKAKFVIGEDTRLSSDMFAAALCAGLTASGADVYLLHVTTTPSVSYLVSKEDFACGIMISASHNPYHDNGIKLLNGRGLKMEAEVEAQIESYIDTGLPEIPMARGEKLGRCFDYSGGREAYLEHLLKIPSLSFEGFKVGLDCSNGSASQLAKRVFASLGAETHVINNEPNGVNINDHCGSTYLPALQTYVRDHGLDLGFAYDGDADRCLAVDGQGQAIDGDGILCICGKYLKERGRLKNNTVVTTIMSNLGLYKAFDREGISYEKTGVGDKYVSENMVKGGHCLGGEQSGHIIFSDYGKTGDGILTSLMMMEVVAESGKSLGSLAGEMEIYPQLLKNVRVKDKTKTLENERVKDVIAAVSDRLGQEGRVLVRPSGTEALVRVMAEARTEEVCREAVEEIIEILAAEKLIEES